MKNRLFWRVPLNPSAVREAAAGWQVPLWTAELMLRRQVSPQALREGWSWENARTLPDMTEAAALVRNVLQGIAVER